MEQSTWSIFIYTLDSDALLFAVLDRHDTTLTNFQLYHIYKLGHDILPFESFVHFLHIPSTWLPSPTMLVSSVHC